MDIESQNELGNLIKRLRKVIVESDSKNLNPLCKICDDMVRLYLKPYCKFACFSVSVIEERDTRYYCSLGNQTLPRFCEVHNGPCSYREERD